MRRMKLALAATLLAASLHVSAQPPAARRTVIVISLDGFPGFALDDPRLPVPTLRKLAAQGSMARRMTAVNPTVTWPNHTAIVTGVDASRHGLLVNGTLTLVGMLVFSFVTVTFAPGTTAPEAS